MNTTETFIIKENKIKNKLGFGADTETNKGKSKTKSTQYLTLSQQINSMLDPELQRNNMMIDTKMTRDEYAGISVGEEEANVNKFKASKHDVMDIGRAVEKKLDEIVEKQMKEKKKPKDGE